jgi:hypothetical protein
MQKLCPFRSAHCICGRISSQAKHARHSVFQSSFSSESAPLTGFIAYAA